MKLNINQDNRKIKILVINSKGFLGSNLIRLKEINELLGDNRLETVKN